MTGLLATAGTAHAHSSPSSLMVLAAPALATSDPMTSPEISSASAPAPESSPSLLWRDVTTLGVTCLVQTPRGVETGPLQQRLCNAVRTRAARGAPVPVAVQALGGEALKPGAVTLLVHANVVSVRGVPVMALTIRPFRNLPDGASLLFAAAPRAVPMNDSAALDQAVQAMLAETLPWAPRGDGSRPID